MLGNSNETTRDTPQRLLFGPIDAYGTGAIPRRLLGEPRRARGLADYFDTIKVKHVSGGWSTIKQKAYEQGRNKMQSVKLNWGWLDEEPPEDVYAEVLTRTNAGGEKVGESGLVYITATPLLGITHVVKSFYPTPKLKSKHLTMMDIWEVEHYTDEQKQAIVDTYPDHERDARSKGIPALGSGKVFPVAAEQLECDIFAVPSHWYQLIGCDFGWDHPTAFVHCAIDRDTQTFYVVNAYRQPRQVAAIHAAAVKPWGNHPVAWPHDGYIHDKSSGEQIAAAYRTNGLRMMMEHSTHPAGGFGTEAGVQEMHQAMLTGKFKVMKHLNDWWGEYHTYHRKDGAIVKSDDDLMSATRMAWMMQRYARTPEVRHTPMTLDAYEPFGAMN